MKSLILILLLLFSGGRALAQDVCTHFWSCYNTGSKARDGGNIPLAIQAYSKACSMDVKRTLIARKYSSCLQIINFSRETDNYQTARTYFEGECAIGSSNGCLFLSKLEAEQGNLERAIELTKSLCREKFRFKVVSGYDSCDELKKHKKAWKLKNPDPPPRPRTVVEITIGFGGIFLFILLSPILLFRKKAGRALISSLLAFAFYVYYESGVPSHAAIRIDLLLIYPALIVNTGLLIGAAIRYWREKKKT